MTDCDISYDTAFDYAIGYVICYLIRYANRFDIGYAISYGPNWKVKLIKHSFVRGGGITLKGIYKQRLKFVDIKLLGGVMLQAFMPCIMRSSSDGGHFYMFTMITLT